MPCVNAFTGNHGVPPTHANVLGVLSLILWSLLLIISVKYLILILRADNRGEGGILALATLVSDVVAARKISLPAGTVWSCIALRGWDDHSGNLGHGSSGGLACCHTVVRSLRPRPLLSSF